MTEISEFSAEQTERWRRFVDLSPQATIAHEIGWREVIRNSLGHQPIYLMATDGNEITGILPLFAVQTWWRSRYIVSLPWIDYGGICAVNKEAEQMLVERACDITRQRKARFMELRSVAKTQTCNLEVSEKKVTFLLELDNDPEIVWKGFNAKLRNQVRKSEKSGLTTHYAGAEKLDSFYRVFARNMRDLGTPVWGKDFFVRILTSFKDTARLILVKKDDRVIASGLVLAFKDRLYVPSASSYRDYLKYCPNHALYWRVIKDACEQGYRYFDFGRSTWGSATFDFKKQWVPEPTQLYWQYYLNSVDTVPAINPDNPKYRLFIDLWRKLPMPVANMVGPRLIKNFP